MPYVDRKTRNLIDNGMEPSSPGELNYQIHEHVLAPYFVSKGVTYTTINEVIGVLECVKMELYRRLGEHYEYNKIVANGDIPMYSAFLKQIYG